MTEKDNKASIFKLLITIIKKINAPQVKIKCTMG